MRNLAGSKRALSLTAILLLWGSAMFFVDGCSRIPLNYLPSSVNKISGSVSVSNFKYLLAETGDVKPFQIRNTALEKLKFDKNIDVYFREAVSAELRLSGVKIDDKTRVLSGEIEDLLVDDLSFDNAHWIMRVHYIIKDLRTGNTLYVSTKTTQCDASKLMNVSSAFNDVIKLNVEELMKDEAFIKAIH
ncbi:MAG TPA: hypothetical protein VMU29_01545 [Smithella sp.]|nr:hypothetical protein [Smithella sp.]